MQSHSSIRGRGASENPPNRFEKLQYIPDPEASENAPAARTSFYKDQSSTFISYNQSPDVPFAASGNPYRGCEHGCAYCYARPTHEFLGFSAGLDFESKIMVKFDAPEILRKELSAKKWVPQSVTLSGVTDCYQPAEKKFQITRRCLEVFLEFRNPVSLITKNQLITRDLDILAELAQHQLISVCISVTTLNPELARTLEPRTSSPRARLEAISQLHAAGVPVGVLVAPVIPGLNEHEIPQILEQAAHAGASYAGYTLLRLPHSVKDIFISWLDQYHSGSKEKILGRIKEIRHGKLNDATFGARFKGEGPLAEQIQQLFAVARKHHKLLAQRPTLTTSLFRSPHNTQLSFNL